MDDVFEKVSAVWLAGLTVHPSHFANPIGDRRCRINRNDLQSFWAAVCVVSCRLIEWMRWVHPTGCCRISISLNTTVGVAMGHHESFRFSDFWPVYVKAHQDQRNRALHFLGTGGAIAIVLAVFLTGQWIFLIAAPVWGYGLAWVGHYRFERNTPAAFSSPVWAFRADIRMFVFMLIGRMSREIEELQIGQVAVSDGAPRGSELETSQLYGHLPPVDGVDSVT